MIKRKTYSTETPKGQSLAQRQAALEARRVAARERTDIGPAYIAQIVAEVAVMEADLGVEIDEWLMAQDILAGQALAEAEGIASDAAVAATSFGG